MSRLGVPSPSADRVPQYFVGLGAALGLVLFVEVVHQILELGDLSTVSIGTLPWAYLLSFLFSVPFIAGIGYGGWYLSTEPFPLRRNLRIFRWCLLGIAVWLVINLLTMLSFGMFSFWPLLGWIRGAVAWGGAFGLLIGLVEARAITNAVASEQARLRAKHFREKQETLDYLNSLLRHEVLNSITVINGHATMLEEKVPESSEYRAHVEPIVRQSADIESFVEDARSLVESLHHEPDRERISLRKLLTAEIEKIRDLNSDVDVDVEVPGEATVYGDRMLSRVFGNLFANAVKHNDSDTPRLSVRASLTDDEVRVCISDNGSGIDQDVRAALFERPDVVSANHGLGLYITSRLCGQYDGDIELVETGDDGTTFAVTLPRAATT